MDFLDDEFRLCARCQEQSNKVLNLESHLQVVLRQVQLLESNLNIVTQENQMRLKIASQKPRKYEQKPQEQIKELQKNINNLKLIVVDKDEIIKTLREDIRTITHKQKDDISIESSACSQTLSNARMPDLDTLPQPENIHAILHQPGDNAQKKMKIS